LALHPKHSHLLLKEIMNCIPIKINGFSLLYKYENPSLSDRFHKLIDFKDNILAIGKTKQGRIFGAFSNLPFDPCRRKHSPAGILGDVKSFLFNVYKD
jgi:hypothetical protein